MRGKVDPKEINRSRSTLLGNARHLEVAKFWTVVLLGPLIGLTMGAAEATTATSEVQGYEDVTGKPGALARSG
eukprot:11396902-Heterocapsa_arctica.AAC.1